MNNNTVPPNSPVVFTCFYWCHHMELFYLLYRYGFSQDFTVLPLHPCNSAWWTNPECTNHFFPELLLFIPIHVPVSSVLLPWHGLFWGWIILIRYGFSNIAAIEHRRFPSFQAFCLICTVWGGNNILTSMHMQRYLNLNIYSIEGDGTNASVKTYRINIVAPEKIEKSGGWKRQGRIQFFYI